MNGPLRAIELSKTSVEAGGFPVGAVILQNDIVIAEGISNGKELHDPTSHAETVAIRRACKELGSRSLRNTTLYSSMEPCLMCLSASSWASIPKIVYAASRERLDPQHFEGTHDIRQINAAMKKPIELVHAEDYEEIALQVIRDWEA
ncbi:MAG: nucleoside deaminase [Acidobacteriota bacterium]